jgi:cyclic-di-AMP phosphodiesterase PgpH
MSFFFSQRRKLARKGLAGGKQRRRLETPVWLQFIRTSKFVSASIALGTLACLIVILVFSQGADESFLTAGQLASRSIFSQMIFSIPDEDATRSAKKAAADATPPVYQIKLPEMIRDAELFTSQLEELNKLNINNLSKAEREKMAQIWNHRLNGKLDATDMSRLIVLTNKPEVAQTVRQMVDEIARRGIVEPDQFVAPTLNIGTYVSDSGSRDLELRRPTEFYTVESARAEFEKQLRKRLVREDKYLTAVVKATQGIFRPNIMYNEVLTERVKNLNAEKVQKIDLKYDQGDTLVMRGERVTKRHLGILKAYHDAREAYSQHENVIQQRLGRAAIICLLFAAGVLVLRYQQFGRPTGNREYALLATIVVLQMLIARGIFYFSDLLNWPSPGVVPYLLMPAFGPILAAILTNTRRANLIALLSSFFLSILADNNMTVLIYSVVTGIVGVALAQGIRRRSQIITAGAGAGVAGSLCALAFAFTSEIDLDSALVHGAASIASGIVASLLISSTLPLFEVAFKVTTGFRWLEMTDLNHPLLRRMFTEAPGTYHHSLSVANLSEAAAEAVRGNSLQARVCSLFHDIGKLVKPDYFAENIRDKENPHDHLAPHMSALIIMAHVKEGIDLALKYHLNRDIIDVIRQHHGTSKVSFFYHLAKRQEQDALEGSKIMKWPEEDVPRVEEETYRYPGPKPQTRESGIVSICDAVESASRSMVNPTPQKVEAMIREIVQEKLQDGQLDDCSLTMNDLNLIIESLNFTLINMLHARISYPKDEDKLEKPPPEIAARAG